MSDLFHNLIFIFVFCISLQHGLVEHAKTWIQVVNLPLTLAWVGLSLFLSRHTPELWSNAQTPHCRELQKTLLSLICNYHVVWDTVVLLLLSKCFSGNVVHQSHRGIKKNSKSKSLCLRDLDSTSLGRSGFHICESPWWLNGQPVLNLLDQISISDHHLKEGRVSVLQPAGGRCQCACFRKDQFIHPPPLLRLTLLDKRNRCRALPLSWPLLQWRHRKWVPGFCDDYIHHSS